VPEVLAKFQDFTADDPALADWSLELLTAAPQARARHPAEGEER
jgi:hypothetical protein